MYLINVYSILHHTTHIIEGVVHCIGMRGIVFELNIHFEGVLINTEMLALLVLVTVLLVESEVGVAAGGLCRMWVELAVGGGRLCSRLSSCVSLCVFTLCAHLLCEVPLGATRDL